MATEPRKPAGRRRALPGEEHLVTRKGSPFWWLDFTIAGERFRESCGTAEFERAAAYAAKRHDDEYRRIQLGEAPARHLTVNEAFVRFWKEVAQGTAYGERAQKHQLARLKVILGGHTRLAAIEDSKVAEVVTALKEAGASPATVNRYVTTLGQVCRRARDVWKVEVGEWKKGHHRQREPEGREVFLNHEQARAVLEHATPHLRPFLALEFLTGLRKGNLTGLVWEHVSLDMGRMVLVQKGDRRLSVPLVADAVRLLQAIQPDPAFRRGPVFVYGNPNVPCLCAACKREDMIGYAWVNPKRAIKTAFRRAGVPEGTRFHDLRHTFASWLLSETGNLKVVQQALGHSQITTTNRYAHLMGDEIASGVSAAASKLFRQEPAPAALPAPAERKKA